MKHEKKRIIVIILWCRYTITPVQWYLLSTLFNTAKSVKVLKIDPLEMLNLVGISSSLSHADLYRVYRYRHSPSYNISRKQGHLPAVIHERILFLLHVRTFYSTTTAILYYIYETRPSVIIISVRTGRASRDYALLCGPKLAPCPDKLIIICAHLIIKIIKISQKVANSQRVNTLVMCIELMEHIWRICFRNIINYLTFFFFFWRINYCQLLKITDHDLRLTRL